MAKPRKQIRNGFCSEFGKHISNHMLTGEIRSQIDCISDAFGSGEISNPLEVIEQITYLLFLKRLDETAGGAARVASGAGACFASLRTTSLEETYDA